MMEVSDNVSHEPVAGRAPLILGGLDFHEITEADDIAVLNLASLAVTDAPTVDESPVGRACVGDDDCVLLQLIKAVHDVVSVAEISINTILSKIASLDKEGAGMIDNLTLSHLIEEVAAPYRSFGVEMNVVRLGAPPEPVCRRNPGMLYGLGNLVENGGDKLGVGGELGHGHVL